MRYYETVVVVDPTGGEGIVEKHQQKVRELIESKGGTVLKVEDWGKRRLAYAIRHKREGHYFLVEFHGPGETVATLDQYYRLQDTILRYLTVLREGPSPEGSVSAVALDRTPVELGEVPSGPEDASARKPQEAHERSGGG